MNVRQKRFAGEYIIDLNATQAAIRAGYSVKTAGAKGFELLKIVEISAAITSALEKRAKRTEITQDMVVKELARLGFNNMLDYIQVTPGGDAYIDLSKLTRDQAAAITEITVDEYAEGRGDEARLVKKVKIKLADKKGPLELLGKHLGMFREKLDVNMTINSWDELEKAAAAKAQAADQPTDQTGPDEQAPSNET